MTETTTEPTRIAKWEVKSLAQNLEILKAQARTKEQELFALLRPRMEAWLTYKDMQREFNAREFEFLRADEDGLEFYTPDMPVAGGYREETYLYLSWAWIENPERVKLETADRRALYEELRKEFKDE